MVHVQSFCTILVALLLLKDFLKKIMCMSVCLWEECPCVSTGVQRVQMSESDRLSLELQAVPVTWLGYWELISGSLVEQYEYLTAELFFPCFFCYLQQSGELALPLVCCSTWKIGPCTLPGQYNRAGLVPKVLVSQLLRAESSGADPAPWQLQHWVS